MDLIFIQLVGKTEHSTINETAKSQMRVNENTDRDSGNEKGQG